MDNTSNIIHNTSGKCKFSVIMPLYNKAPYVKKALESVVAQTFRDFELIIIDDGSTDNSAELCEAFFNTSNIKHNTLLVEHDITHNTSHIIHQTNSGVAAARNRGVTESHGEFVCFLDADDWWEPTFLEEIDKLIKEYSDAGIYATNYIYYKPGKTHVALRLERGYMNYPEAYLRSTAMPVWTGASCIPRKVFDEMDGFPVGVKLGEDFLLWAKTALHYKVAFCEKPLAYYNNDVPAPMRATRNLHEPKCHKLFNLQEIETQINQLQDDEQKERWNALLDTHRVQELFEYWLSDKYHDAAKHELEKVDWSKQPQSVIRKYKMPIWYQRTKGKIFKIGSYCKQMIIKTICR